MGYTAFYNPATGSRQIYNNTELNGSKIIELQRQGWVSIYAGPYQPTSTQLDFLVSHSPNVNPETARTLAALTRESLARISTKSIVTPIATAGGADVSKLSSFRTPDGGYNLIEIMRNSQNNPELDVIARQYFNSSDINYAVEANKPIWDTTTKSGSDAWDKLSPEKKALFRPVRNVDIVEYNQLSDIDKLYIKDIIPTKVSQKAYAQLGKGSKKYAAPEARGLEKISAGSIIAAEVILPGLYTARHWNEMSGGEKGLIITLDAISIIPFTGAATRGAREVTAASRAARVKGAIKGISSEAISQVRWPVDLVVHPIETTKGMVTGVKYSARNVQSLIENIAHPSKLPEAIITTADGTVRLPVKSTTSTEEALKIRDTIMSLRSQGKTPIVEMGNARVELSTSPLMRETKGGLVHATPMGESFEHGAKVTVKPGMPSSEQGLFFSHEPLPRFTEVSAFGKSGSKPVFIIISKDTAKNAVETGKIYRGTVEMERKLPVGTKVYEPKQKLFTRIGPEQYKVEIWLEEPLTKAQIAKLKAQSLIEAVKTIFEPSIKITKLDNGLSPEEIRKLASVIRETDLDAARRLVRTGRIVARGRSAPPSLARLVGRAKYRASTTSVARIARERPYTRASRKATGRAEATRARSAAAEREAYVAGVARAERIERTDRKAGISRAERISRSKMQRRVDSVDRADRPPRLTGGDRPFRIEQGRKTGTPRIRFPDSTSESKRKQLLEGMATWKQGFGWWTIYPPYGNKDRVFTLKPIKGVKQYTGARSAYKTLAVMGKYFPRKVKQDLGIMDIEISKKGLKFRRDVKRRTHLGYSEDSPTITVMR